MSRNSSAGTATANTNRVSASVDAADQRPLRAIAKPSAISTNNGAVSATKGTTALIGDGLWQTRARELRTHASRRDRPARVGPAAPRRAARAPHRHLQLAALGLVPAVQADDQR